MRIIEDNIYLDIMGIGSQSHYGVFIYDLVQKRFIYTNRRFTEIFKVEEETLKQQSKTVLQYILTEDQAYLESRLDEVMANGSIDSTEFRLVFPGDEHIHLSCDAFLIRENTAITGFVKDITREKEHENYVVEITAQKDAFLDMITHNLSGPLVLSQNILSWVQKSVSGNKTTDIDSLLVLLQESTQQCIDIVNDFLSEEHKESQVIFVRKTRFDIVEKIRVVLDKLKDFTPNKTFKLDTNITNVNINTDSVKFFQIVHNLISNAIKFTGDNGIITTTLTEEGDSFIFSVADNGIGIPADMQPHIFDKRTAAGRTGLQGERSNGIGLSIIRKLVELIGGEIWFESKENTGSTFYVKLPKE